MMDKKLKKIFCVDCLLKTVVFYLLLQQIAIKLGLTVHVVEEQCVGKKENKWW
jgi:hypothetical protein